MGWLEPVIQGLVTNAAWALILLFIASRAFRRWTGKQLIKLGKWLREKKNGYLLAFKEGTFYNHASLEWIPLSGTLLLALLG